MADGDNSTNALYDLIRRELNSIIIENEKSENQPNSTNVIDLKCKENSKMHLKEPTKEDVHKGQSQPIAENISLSDGTTSPMQHSSTFLSNSSTLHASPHEVTTIIDTDLQNMQEDLQKSYELFRETSEKFQAINFSSLKTRIREMNLGGKRDSNLKLNDEIRNVVQSHYSNNTLSKLTADMGEKFRQHPGEFGDIPEVSEFFQTCTHLQHGLEQLKRQRSSVDQLTRRICTAAEASYARMNEIQEQIRSKDLCSEDKRNY